MMHQQLLEKAQSKYVLATAETMFVQRFAIEPTSTVRYHFIKIAKILKNVV